MTTTPPEADYYTVLELTQSATADSIKRAYRRLSLVRHPDKDTRNAGAHAAFCLLNEAYDTLKDCNRRVLYDARYASIKTGWTDFQTAREREQAEQDAKRTKMRRAQEENIEREKARQRRAEEERVEREKIGRIREDIAKVKRQIEEVEKARKERMDREVDGQGWWSYLTMGWRNGAEEVEKEKIRKEQENLQKLASERIKIKRWRSEMKGLQRDEEVQLKSMWESEMRDYAPREKETQARKARENAAREKAARERQAHENAARERAAEERESREKEARAREERENAARESTARERHAARERAAKQGELREKEVRASENAARDRAAKKRQARKTARRERAAKKKEMHEREVGSTGKAKQQSKVYGSTETGTPNRCEQEREAGGNPAKQKVYPQSPKASTQAKNVDTHGGPCRHAGFWAKVEGRHRCEVCAKVLNSFILQRPQCLFMACAACKRQL